VITASSRSQSLHKVGVEDPGPPGPHGRGPRRTRSLAVVAPEPSGCVDPSRAGRAASGECVLGERSSSGGISSGRQRLRVRLDVVPWGRVCEGCSGADGGAAAGLPGADRAPGRSGRRRRGRAGAGAGPAARFRAGGPGAAAGRGWPGRALGEYQVALERARSTVEQLDATGATAPATVVAELQAPAGRPAQPGGSDPGCGHAAAGARPRRRPHLRVPRRRDQGRVPSPRV